MPVRVLLRRQRSGFLTLNIVQRNIVLYDPVPDLISEDTSVCCLVFSANSFPTTQSELKALFLL